MDVKRLKEKNYFSGIAIAALILFITYLHYSTTHRILPLHGIYRELYFIPLLFGALRFGLKGTLITYLFITMLYLPYVFTSWTGVFITELDRLLDILVLGLFAFLAGFLIDRDRRYREQLLRERYLAGIGQVATTIVHDLKNSLITILWFARSIMEGKGNINDSAQTITNAAKDMERIVHDVLDFAKPMKLELKIEDVRNVINRACDSCRTKAKEQGVNILIELPANPVNIEMDSFHVERTMVNLINNAIEASRKGQEVRIMTAIKRNYMIVKIKDYGLGIDKETIENIFTPFYTNKSEGTGLGMPIAKKIIDAHKGRIYIESQPETGTEVTIRLPYRLTVKEER
jgi:two-component system sensor histidine kinase HydH